MTNKTMQATPPNARQPDAAQGPVLHTASGAHALELRLATNFISRFCGLMLRAPLQAQQGLLLTGCPSVHTLFMRGAIDVIYLDASGTVRKCVPRLTPWRGSFSQTGRDEQGRRHARAAHTLELAAGTIERLGIRAGDRLAHPHWPQATAAQPHAAPKGTRRQRGSALIELAVVGPILTVLGLSLVQYGLLFFAKNQINHASFMAARAGSVGHADLGQVRDAYAQALIPLYGGGQTAAELAASLCRARDEVYGTLVCPIGGARTPPPGVRVELLNPTRESFDDWNDALLQSTEGKGKGKNSGDARVIPNSNLAFKSQAIGSHSGQTISDANLIKLRITTGVAPAVPIVASLYKAYLKWLDPKTDDFHTQLVNAGRIPVVTHVTLHMQSDPIEPANPVSSPGAGNAGNPSDPGDAGNPPDPGSPPDCPYGGCNTPPVSPTPPDGGGSCPAPLPTKLDADALFDFDQSTLKPAGIAQLDDLIAKANAKGTGFDTLNVTGYTDPLGTDAHNLALSTARAQAVRDYLINHGLKATHVNVAGKGAADLVTPLSACQNMGVAAQQACLADDRRVIVELIPKQ